MEDYRKERAIDFGISNEMNRSSTYSGATAKSLIAAATGIVYVGLSENLDADLIRMDYVSSNPAITGDGVVVETFDNPALSDGYNINADRKWEFQPPTPEGVSIINRAAVTGERLEYNATNDIIMPDHIGRTWQFDLVGIDGDGGGFTANTYLDVSGTLLSNDVDVGLKVYNGASLNLVYDGTVRDLLENHDGKTPTFEMIAQDNSSELTPTGLAFADVREHAIPEPSALALGALAIGTYVGAKAISGAKRILGKKKGKKINSIDDIE